MNTPHLALTRSSPPTEADPLPRLSAAGTPDARAAGLVDILQCDPCDSADAGRTLTDVACTIGNRILCDACSIYRLDRQRQALILAATVGLRQGCVDRLWMNITEGLSGLVIQQNGPVNVPARAAEHPRFKYFPEAGEDPYESYLGVPVVDGGCVVGVLVVQTIEPRTFTDAEARSLVLCGRRIGPLLERLRHEKDAR